MADQVQWRGGSRDNSDGFTGAPREVTVDTTDWILRVHDGIKPGGHKMMKVNDCLVVETADKCDPTAEECKVTINGDLEVDGDTNLGDTIIDGNLVVNGNFLQDGITLAVKTDEVILTNPGAINTRDVKGICNILPPSPPLKTQEDANQYIDACLGALENAICDFDLTAIDEIQDIKDELDKILIAIANLEGRVDILESQMAAVLARLDLIEQAIALIETELEAIQNNVTENSKAIEALKVLVADLAQEITDLEASIGDGKITIKSIDGVTIGDFTVNQKGPTDITLPATFSGDYNDLNNLPEINDGSMYLQSESGVAYGSFSANEASDIFISIPDPFSGDFDDLVNKPDIGDGKITIKESDNTKVGEFTVNQKGNTEITLPQVIIPEALHPKGFIDVDDTAPADPVHGDIYIQSVDATADITFAPGLTGEVKEGNFVIFGVDDLWHSGGNATTTQEQSDWNELDQTSAAFILNKPDGRGDGEIGFWKRSGTTLSPLNSFDEIKTDGQVNSGNLSAGTGSRLNPGGTIESRVDGGGNALTFYNGGTNVSDITANIDGTGAATFAGEAFKVTSSGSTVITKSSKSEAEAKGSRSLSIFNGTDRQFAVTQNGDIYAGGVIDPAQPSVHDPKVAIMADGSGVFSGNLAVNGGTTNPTNTDGLEFWDYRGTNPAYGMVINAINRVDGSGFLPLTIGSKTFNLDRNGSADFEGELQARNLNVNYRKGRTGAVFQGYAGEASEDAALFTSQINSDGSVSFANGDFAVDGNGVIQTNIKSAGNILLDSTASFSPPKITLKATDGSSSFSGDMEIKDSSYFRLRATGSNDQTAIQLAPDGSAAFSGRVASEEYFTADRDIDTAGAALYLGFHRGDQKFKVGTDGQATFGSSTEQSVNLRPGMTGTGDAIWLQNPDNSRPFLVGADGSALYAGSVTVKQELSSTFASPAFVVSNAQQDQVIRLNNNGQIHAQEFHGDGSKLDGVMPLDIRTLPTLN